MKIETCSGSQEAPKSCCSGGNVAQLTTGTDPDSARYMEPNGDIFGRVGFAHITSEV